MPVFFQLLVFFPSHLMAFSPSTIPTIQTNSTNLTIQIYPVKPFCLLFNRDDPNNQNDPNAQNAQNDHNDLNHLNHKKNPINLS
jgi:hypothetical protein